MSFRPLVLLVPSLAAAVGLGLSLGVLGVALGRLVGEAVMLTILIGGFLYKVVRRPEPG